MWSPAVQSVVHPIEHHATGLHSLWQFDPPRPATESLMIRRTAPLSRIASGAALLVFALAHPSASQQQQGRGRDPENAWDVTQPHGKTRDIDFTTSEGTWMA